MPSQEDLQFAAEALKQGILRPQEVETCLDALRNLERAGVYLYLFQVVMEKKLLKGNHVLGLLRQGGCTVATCAKCQSRYYAPHPVPPGLTCAKCHGGLAETRDYGSSKIAGRLFKDGRFVAGRPDADPFIGQTIGGYRVVGKLGVGGMGAVYRALQVRLEREVALKILPLQLAQDSEFVSRFEREAKSAARLNHPNIVQVYDVGHEGGCRYYSMEYVQGESASDVLAKEGRVREEWAREIAIAAGQALVHAHHLGILHRDVKPGNILISDAGAIKLGDFGLAKWIRSDPGLTDSSAAVGTPYYAAPEQLEAARDIDARADIYSLGATMYHMLSGDVPYPGTTVAEVVRRQIKEPVKPLRERNPALSRGICAVVERAMARDRDARYQTMEEMLDALRELRSSESYQAVAKTATLDALLRRVLGDWRIRAVALSCVVVAVVFFVHVAMRRRNDDRGISVTAKTAEGPQVSAKSAKTAVTQQNHVSVPARSENQPAPTNGVSRMPASAGPSERLPLPSSESRASAEEFGFKKFLGQKVAAPDEEGRMRGLPAGTMLNMRYSRDGRYVAVAHMFGVDLWETQAWTVTRRLDGHTRPVTSVDFSPDGSRLASASADGQVVVWDMSQGRALWKSAKSWSYMYCVAFHPRGIELASSDAGSKHRVIIWEPETGEMLGVLKGHTNCVHAVAFSPDGAQMASGSSDKTVRVWDAQTRTEARCLEGHSTQVLSVAFSPVGSVLASGSSDGTILVWDVKTGNILQSLRSPGWGVCSLSFDPSGSLLAASAGGGDFFRIWRVDKGDELLRVRLANTRAASFSPDGKLVAAASPNERVAALFDVATGKEVRRTAPYGFSFTAVAFSPTNPRLVVSSSMEQSSNCYEVWDVEREKPLSAMLGTPHFGRMSFTCDGKQMVCFQGGQVVVCDAITCDRIRVLGDLSALGHSRRCLALSPDGSRMAYRSDQETVKVTDFRSGHAISEIRGHKTDVLALSPDGRLLASASSEGDPVVLLWDTSSGREVRALPAGENAGVTSIAVSPDGRLLACGASDGIVRVWSLEDPQSSQRLKGHEAGIRSVAFSPDARHLASGGDDGTIRLWDVKSGHETQVLTVHRDQVWDVSFSCDGRLLASASLDGQICLWQKVAK